MTISKFISLTSLSLWIFLQGCQQSEYSKVLKVELAKEGRIDSVLLGINLGDTKKKFMDRCTVLNKQQLVTMGERGAVLYILKDSINQKNDSDLRLLIFPRYDDNDVISDVDLEFSYNGWAPWNKQYQSDILEKNLIELLKNWYSGNDFLYHEINGNKVPVKIDHNRRIFLKKKDTQTVIVKVQDITSDKFLGKKLD